MVKRVIAAAAIAILLAACRTEDVLKSSGDFKAGSDRVSQLAAQVFTDQHGSCIRRLQLQSLRPPEGSDQLPRDARSPLDESTIAKKCAGEFAAALQVRGTFDKVTAYYAELNAAATGKTPDFDITAGTTALKKAEILDDTQAGVIDAIAGKLGTYLVGHARVVAIRNAVDTVDPVLQIVDTKVQAYFTVGNCSTATYNCNLQDETNTITSIYQQYFDTMSMPGTAKQPSVADRFAILQLVRDRDTLLANQQGRIERGSQLADAFHQMAIKHHKLFVLIHRTPDADEALFDRL